ncbi:MAG: SPOR domain-containing protein [Candidatus Kryptoniota bacterium]
MKSFLFFVAFLTFFLCHESAVAQRFTTKSHDAKAQTTQETENQNGEEAYTALKAGKLDDARKFLADANLSDPLAKYVRAALDQNAAEAAGIYKDIVAENPGKPIGRDALVQLYKYHFAEGNYKSAHTDYLELQKYSGYQIAGLIDPAGFKDSIQTQEAFNNSQKFPETPAPNTVSSTGEGGNFVVQIGVFSTPENAREFAEKLRTKNVDAIVFTKVEDEKTLYAVSAGKFSTLEAAEAFASDLKNRSIDCIVVQK